MLRGEYPIEPKFKKSMNKLAEILEEFLSKGFKKKVGFCLFVFDFEKGPINYISNADRGDMIRTLKEILEHWEEKKRMEN